MDYPSCTCTIHVQDNFWALKSLLVKQQTLHPPKCKMTKRSHPRWKCSRTRQHAKRQPPKDGVRSGKSLFIDPLCYMHDLLLLGLHTRNPCFGIDFNRAKHRSSPTATRASHTIQISILSDLNQNS